MGVKTPRVKKSAFQPVASRAEEQERCGRCSILHLHTAETESRLNTHSHRLAHTRSLAFSPPSQSITEGGVGGGGGCWELRNEPKGRENTTGMEVGVRR